LLRERRLRTAVFTLALPVSRLRLIVTQMVVGISELAALSLLPALLIPSLSLLIHQHYSLAEALNFSILWFGCCSVIFAASFLLSVVLDGEYTAPMACYVALMLKVLISNWPSLRPYRLNLMWTMGEFGRMHWKLQHNLLLSDPLPWARLLTILSITLGMLALAARITQKQDF
jgi:ABC-2 type transport system permease protein